MAAIRAWTRSEYPVSDTLFKAFQDVAVTGKMPPAAKLTFLNSFENYNNFHFDMWMVDLTIMEDAGRGFTYRLRDC